MQINTKQTIFCDNAAAISRANTTFGPGIKHYTTTDYDVAKEIDAMQMSRHSVYTPHCTYSHH
eukprot:10088877-Ditylum_brightwellii.AAC.1